MSPLPPMQQQSALPPRDHEPEQLNLFGHPSEFRRKSYALISDPDNDDYLNAGDDSARHTPTACKDRGSYIGLLRPHTD